MVKFDEAEDEATTPLIVAVVSTDTGDVVIANNAVDDPLETVTDGGTTALLFEDFSATTIPPVPALLVKVTVPVELEPPLTVAGDTLTLLRV